MTYAQLEMLQVQREVLQTRATAIKQLLQSYDGNEYLALELAIVLSQIDKLSLLLKRG